MRHTSFFPFINVLIIYLPVPKLPDLKIKAPHRPVDKGSTILDVQSSVTTQDEQTMKIVIDNSF